MAWLRVESSVARHRKFMQAGPAPSWLWVCGLAYCQEGLTDGFIPTQALPYLGVKNAPQLVKHLVSAGLWEPVDGGWQVHDYLTYNRSADTVQQIRTTRRAAGTHGGVASGKARQSKQPVEANAKQVAEASAKQVSNPLDIGHRSLDMGHGSATEAFASPPGDPGTFPFAVWFDAICRAYPEARVHKGRLTQELFVTVLVRATDGPVAAFARMSANLEAQKRGHQWRVDGKILRLDRWLESGQWEAVHEERPAHLQVSERTARTLTSAKAFLEEPPDGTN